MLDPRVIARLFDKHRFHASQHVSIRLLADMPPSEFPLFYKSITDTMMMTLAREFRDNHVQPAPSLKRVLDEASNSRDGTGRFTASVYILTEDELFAIIGAAQRQPDATAKGPMYYNDERAKWERAPLLQKTGEAPISPESRTMKRPDYFEKEKSNDAQIQRLTDKGRD